MSMGPLGGIVGSAAGAPLSQTKGSEAERTQQDAGALERQLKTDEHAENAAGIGTTEEDQQTNDRDADGRRLWEAPPKSPNEEAEGDAENPTGGMADVTRQSKDATGQSGNQLDLTG